MAMSTQQRAATLGGMATPQREAALAAMPLQERGEATQGVIAAARAEALSLLEPVERQRALSALPKEERALALQAVPAGMGVRAEARRKETAVLCLLRLQWAQAVVERLRLALGKGLGEWRGNMAREAVDALRQQGRELTREVESTQGNLQSRNERISDKFFASRRRKRAFAGWRGCAIMEQGFGFKLADTYFIHATLYKSRLIFSHWAKEVKLSKIRGTFTERDPGSSLSPGERQAYEDRLTALQQEYQLAKDVCSKLNQQVPLNVIT